MKNDKLQSIRADEETIKRFKEIATRFDNQGEALSSIIEAYEIQNAQRLLPKQADTIAAFDDCVKKAKELFIATLDCQQIAEEHAREEVAGQLRSKDAVISDLQIRVDEYKNRAAAAEDELETLQASSNERIQEAESRASQAENNAATLKELNSVLTTSLDNYKSYESKMKELEEISSNQADEITKLRNELAAAKNTISEMSKDMEIHKERHTAEIEKVRAEAVTQSYADIKELYNKLDEAKDRIAELESIS